jgi:hypothetical protein
MPIWNWSRRNRMPAAWSLVAIARVAALRLYRSKAHEDDLSGRLSLRRGTGN